MVSTIFMVWLSYINKLIKIIENGYEYNWCPNWWLYKKYPVIFLYNKPEYRDGVGIEARSAIVGYVVTYVESNSSLTIFFTMANSSEISITESQIMSEGDQSTPVINKRTEENEIVKIMQTLFEIQNNKFDEKFSDLKSDINENKK